MATLQDYLGITALRDAWPKWKANVIAINNQVIAHVAGTADKHSAQDIPYTGDFVGKTEVKAALDQAKTEIDTIVISASIDPEVAFARDSAVKSKVFGSLDDRLEEDEQDLVSYKADMASQNYVNVKNYGAIGDGVADDTVAIQNAINTNKSVFIPYGTYRITASLILHHYDFIGSGTNSTYFKIDGSFHAFLIQSQFFTNQRNSCKVNGFAVNSFNSQSDDKYVFYAGGVADGGASGVYSYGINFSDIEICNPNTGVRFGGGFYFSDCFRMNVEKIGMTNVANPARVHGSVVQCTFDKITNNSDEAPVSTIFNVGFHSAFRTYSNGTMTPESIKMDNCSFVKNHIGVRHVSGLFCRYNNLDLDYCKDIGIYMASDATFQNCYIASSNTVSKFIGVKFQMSQTVKPIPEIIDNIQIRAYVPLFTGSVAIEYGDGGASPYIFQWGGTIRNCHITGAQNGFTKGIEADRSRSVFIENNIINAGVVTGLCLNLTYCKMCKVTTNIFDGGEIHVEGESATAYGYVGYNKALVTSASIITPANWEFKNNFV